MKVCVQQADFDLNTEIAALRQSNPAIGAVVSFVGLVRDMNEGQDVSAMTLEHYPGMTEKALENIILQAQTRWAVQDAVIIHRVGALLPLDQIVLVAVATQHRGEAFAACEFMMDYLKTQAPFWKKESTPQGDHWVDARETDDRALAKWGLTSANATPSNGGAT
ncbi:MAG: molybdopterin synthase catalytic subunit MoaE [Burkholderiales bacterium]|nr:molybdopterin synthase catalytic subunit MoaE [Burkholderiales bacterium]